jgi:heterodisulfide reductase subunit A-like polyferredoxin
MNGHAVHRLTGTLIAALLVSPSVAHESNAPSLNSGMTCHLAVIGGTPCGIACAVRAAREGLSVVLVNRHDHLGGMLSSNRRSCSPG